VSDINSIDAVRLFSDFLRVTGVPHLGAEKEGDPNLLGKRLGLVNAGAWIALWSNYFGRLFMPGVHLINAGNEAVQLNFMQAHADGQPTPPQSSIDAFVSYARDLVELAKVDAVMITCSTMSRSYSQVQTALESYDIPVIQIDRPMMEQAVRHGGRVLVVATHGPTVESTQALLRETAEDLGQEVTYSGMNLEEAWHCLAKGDVLKHNQTLASGIRSHLSKEEVDCVVLAQLSMTVFLLSHPDPEADFGVPVFTSGQCGFEHARQVLLAL
jgi:aspartate/glutamate racemase